MRIALPPLREERLALGDLAVRATIWLALVSWGLAEWLRLARGAKGERVPASGPGAARVLWALGALFALAHVLAAFHFVHGWSHASAVADTARQTEQALGFAFGGGVYVNYAFLAVWALDAAWWWLRPRSFGARPAALDAAVRAFILFMFVNGAVVFPHGPVRTLGVLVVVALGTAWYLRGRARMKTRQQTRRARS